MRAAFQRLEREGYVVASTTHQARMTVAPLTKEDVGELLAIVGEELEPANGPFMPGSPWYAEGTGNPEYNPEEAKKLVQKVKDEGDGTFEFTYTAEPGAKTLIVREVFNDWDTEERGTLWIERTDTVGRPARPLTHEGESLRRAHPRPPQVDGDVGPHPEPEPVPDERCEQHPEDHEGEPREPREVGPGARPAAPVGGHAETIA